MLWQVFSVYDSKARAFLTPFFLPTVEVAVRAVTEAVSDPSHQFAKHSADYTLYRVGQFDDARGELEPQQPGENLGVVASFLSPEVK